MTSPPREADDRRIDVGGRALYLVRAGAGAPPVVLEAGHANGSAVWSADLLRPGSGRPMVQAGAAAVSCVYAYDRSNAGERPGRAGRSDRAPTPRRADDLVADLRGLLAAAGVPVPRVLVGHSLGVLLARLYAHRHPAEVAGLVLVDGAHEEYDARLLDLVGPRAVAGQRRSAALAPDPEGLDLADCYAQVRAARLASPLGSLPLVVLAHGRPPHPDDAPRGWPLADHERLWRALQEDLAGLTPGGRLVVAAGCGHYIHQEAPELVVGAIRQVVAAVRDPGTWGTPVPDAPPP